jgi:hypothetical protein
MSAEAGQGVARFPSLFQAQIRDRGGRGSGLKPPEPARELLKLDVAGEALGEAFGRGLCRRLEPELPPVTAPTIERA